MMTYFPNLVANDKLFSLIFGKTITYFLVAQQK